MIKAILYKEWIKCRSLLMLLIMISVALVVYLFINNANLLRTDGAVAVWGQIAEGGFSLFSPYITLFMPLAAIAIAVVQYSAEMRFKRFKLTLHLPYAEGRIVGAMLLSGVVMLSLLYALILVPCYAGLSLYYTEELLHSMLISAAPYGLCGVASYLFAVWVIVEPVWRQRAWNLLIAVISLAPFFIGASYGITRYMFAAQLLIVGLSAAAAYYSAARFKEGAQK